MSKKHDLRKATVESGVSSDKIVIQNMVVNANNFVNGGKTKTSTGK